MDFIRPVGINDVYSLNKKTPTGEENPFRAKIMAPTYAHEVKHLWALLEVRNDLAEIPLIQEIVGNAIKRALQDHRVRTELAMRPRKIEKIRAGRTATIRTSDTPTALCALSRASALNQTFPRCETQHFSSTEVSSEVYSVYSGEA